MTWPDQTPPATDVILHVNVPCAGGSPAYLEIDKLLDGRCRATVGTLFEFQEVCRTRDLEALVRHAHAMAGCRSFSDVVDAFRAIRSADVTSGRNIKPIMVVSVPRRKERAMNWQQVRAKIERGESGDKIGGFDPAAAPLGTDDEAAGVPTHPVEEDANPGGAPVRRNHFRRH